MLHGKHIITVCNCNFNGTKNGVCDKFDGSCVCLDGHHGKQCQGESCKNYVNSKNKSGAHHLEWLE